MREMTRETRGLVMDAIGDAFTKDFGKDFESTLVRLVEYGDNIQPGLSAFIGRVKKDFFELMSASEPVEKLQLTGLEVDIYIRQVIQDKYETIKAGISSPCVDIAEWRPTAKRVEDSVRKVEDILSTYDRKCTNWYSQARDQVRALNDPIAEAIFAWSIM